MNQRDSSADAWRSTMEASSKRTVAALVGVAVLLLAAAVLVARSAGRLPARQSDVCAAAYARAPTAAESSVVDDRNIGGLRTPGRWTCGNERAILRQLHP